MGNSVHAINVRDVRCCSPIARPSARRRPTLCFSRRTFPPLTGLLSSTLEPAPAYSRSWRRYAGLEKFLFSIKSAAIDAARENAARNGVGDRLVPLAVGNSIVPLPDGDTVDVIISNPAQLPLPEPAEATSPSIPGPDGRRMIDEVINTAPGRLAPNGQLLMVQNSVTDFPKSLSLMHSVGLRPQVLEERSFELRHLFDRDWIDQLGGVSRGLYSIRNGTAYETIYAIEARRE